MLLGARLTDPKDAQAKNVSAIEPRIRTGVLLAPPGRGDGLSDFAKENFSELNPDYSQLKAPTLVIVGDDDVNPFITVRGPEWYRAAFEDAPGATHLITLSGGRHGLGGVAGYAAKETSDEDPDRLAVVQRATAAFLLSQLYRDDPNWQCIVDGLQSKDNGLAKIETK